MSNMPELDCAHHFFRHIGLQSIHDDFIDPAAFRLRTDKQNGQLEKGLSVNWLEYFQTSTPQEAITPLRDTLEGKGRKIGAKSKFALLNVGAAKNAAVKYTTVAIVHDKEGNDHSHCLINGYEAYNDQVAEALAKVIIGTFPAKP